MISFAVETEKNSLIYRSYSAFIGCRTDNCVWENGAIYRKQDGK